MGEKISAEAGHFFRTAEAIQWNAPDEIRHELIISQTDRFRAPLEKCLVILPRVDEARRDRIDRYAKGSQFIGQTTAPPQSCRPDSVRQHIVDAQSRTASQPLGVARSHGSTLRPTYGLHVRTQQAGELRKTLDDLIKYTISPCNNKS